MDEDESELLFWWWGRGNGGHVPAVSGSYVAEDGVSPYVTEGGVDPYVTEN